MTLAACEIDTVGAPVVVTADGFWAALTLDSSRAGPFAGAGDPLTGAGDALDGVGSGVGTPEGVGRPLDGVGNPLEDTAGA